MPLKFADLDPPATDQEVVLWHTPTLIARVRRSKEWDVRRAKGPTHRLRTLAYSAVGSQERFTSHTRPAQMSALIAAVRLATGAEFSSATEFSLVDDAPCAVLVTLKKAALRGEPPPRLAPDGSAP